MDELIRRHRNFLWLIGLAADSIRPQYLDRYYDSLWRGFVFHGVCEMSVKRLEDVRWDLVQGYAMDKMFRLFTIQV